MYVTAQRVHDLQRRHLQGINGFLYPHENLDIPQTDANRPDVEAVATHPPGDPAEQLYSLTPGGNGVLSYLDIACPDDLPLDELRAAFSQFDDIVPREKTDYPFQHTEAVERVGIRVYLSPRTILSPDLEYRTLSQTVLRLLAIHRGLDLSTLRIQKDLLEDTWRFLPLTTEYAISSPCGEPADIAITIDRDTRHAFEHTGGSIYPMVAENLFDMTPERLIEHGGVEVIDGESGDIIWRGP